MSNDVISKTGGNALTHVAPVASPAELAKSSTERRLARLEAFLAERQEGLPVWVRSPKSGTEHYTGFSRAKLYEGAAKGHFRSVSIREPGQIKGTRLFHLASILAFIERSEAEAVKGGE
jgi:hypothetical protein